MEMAGDAYISHLVDLVGEGTVAESAIDTAVGNILRIKFEMGLFENPYVILPTIRRSPAPKRWMLLAGQHARASSCLRTRTRHCRSTRTACRLSP